VEREEENITMALQKTLHKLIQEKVELESELEQEQEFIINSMSRELARAFSEKL